MKAVGGYILHHKLRTITYRHIQRGDRTMRKLKHWDTNAIFEQFEALGWARPMMDEEGKKVDGKWDINPAVHTKFKERAAKEAERRKAVQELIKEQVAMSKKGG